MRYYGASSGGMMENPMVDQQGGIIAQFMAKLPTELQVVLNILAVVVIAAIVGKIIGNMYSSVKYPDPEKNPIISPKLRVLFTCILAACCIWLFATMTQKNTETPQPEEPGTEQGMPESSDSSDGEFNGAAGGGVVIMR